MDLTEEQKEQFESRYTGRDRYFLIDVDGTKAGWSGWQQRPAAERATRGRGLGVYDRREREVIVEPDRGTRLADLHSRLASKLSEADDLRADIARVQGAD